MVFLIDPILCRRGIRGRFGWPLCRPARRLIEFEFEELRMRWIRAKDRSYEGEEGSDVGDDDN